MFAGSLVRAAGGQVVKAGQPFVPEVLYQGNYYPICGHFFWDSQDGAATVCKNLGFSGGELKNWPVRSSNEGYTKDAMPVGTCDVSQHLDKCTDGGNAWGDLGYGNGFCRMGNHVKIEVTCFGE